jgi:hypothetical protein
MYSWGSSTRHAKMNKQHGRITRSMGVTVADEKDVQRRFGYGRSMEIPQKDPRYQTAIHKRRPNCQNSQRLTHGIELLQHGNC